ncbi:zinc finger protein 182-like [Mytilus californianus]|uniref:zinc finger protein 182-like n=1 Tax=Mytilus californianus TaxID=6549 RepID=UPI0022477774|nr:zinc finger protein 182-like [Mytilus californianus]
MQEESYIVMQNFDNEELGLSSADLNTIIQVPTLEPFILSEESVLENISSIDASGIHGDLLENLDQMELHLECDDDRNYDMPCISDDVHVLPTALFGNNVSLCISFSNNSSVKLEKECKNEYSCSLCNEKFKFESKFCMHMLNNHQVANPFQCESCNYAASCRKVLLKHFKRRHTKILDSKKPHFSDVTSESQKQNEQDPINEIVLPDTEPEYNTTGGSDRSDISHQEQNNSNCVSQVDSVLKCSQCDYTCKQKRSLLLHIKRHSGEYDSQCDICQKKFVTTTALKRHSKTHQETRSFVCTFESCNKSFKVKSALTDHKRYVHGKTCIDVKQNGHKKQQSKSKNCDKKCNYKCTYDKCEKSFRDSYNLRTHMAVHTGVKEQKCPDCDFICVQKASMNWHLKSKHNK